MNKTLIVGVIGALISLVIYLLKPPPFSEDEYDNFVHVIVAAQILKETCGSPRANKNVRELYRESLITYNFSTLRDNNVQVAAIAKILHENIEEIYFRYTLAENVPSKVYCETKANSIMNQARLGTVATQHSVKVTKQK